MLIKLPGCFLPAECLDHGFAQISRAVYDMNTGCFHCSYLVVSGSFATGDNGTCMTHSASWRRCASGDKSDNGFFEIFLNILGGLFLCASANFTNHNKPFGLIISRKELDGIDKPCTNNRIASNTDAG